MAGTQFLHVASYGNSSREGTNGKDADGILAEAMREPSHCLHVADPRPPTVLFGNPKGIAEEVARMGKVGRVRLANGRERKVAKDAKLLLGGVVSYPASMRQLRDEWSDYAKAVREAKRKGLPPPAEPATLASYRSWEAKTMAWLRKRWGEQLRAVVRHTDEGAPHLHFYAVARMTPDGLVDVRGLHPGNDAKAATRAANRKAKGDAEYRAALQALQDEFFEAVGRGCGHARTGPRRRRMSREEWLAEQERNDREAELIAEVEGHAAEVARLRTEAERARLAERAALDALADRDALVDALQVKADATASRAQADLRKAHGVIESLLSSPKLYEETRRKRSPGGAAKGAPPVGMKPPRPSL